MERRFDPEMQLPWIPSNDELPKRFLEKGFSGSFGSLATFQISLPSTFFNCWIVLDLIETALLLLTATRFVFIDITLITRMEESGETICFDFQFRTSCDVLSLPHNFTLKWIFRSNPLTVRWIESLTQFRSLLSSYITVWHATLPLSQLFFIN